MNTPYLKQITAVMLGKHKEKIGKIIDAQCKLLRPCTHQLLRGEWNNNGKCARRGIRMKPMNKCHFAAK